MCPLTPEETALTLKGLDIDPQMQIYIAAGDIYGGERRMAPLRKAFPNLVNEKLQYTYEISRRIYYNALPI